METTRYPEDTQLRLCPQPKRKQAMTLRLASTKPGSPRSTEIYDSGMNANHRRTDRMFCVLLLLQWIGGVVAALLISPTTYAGVSASIHPHVMAAVFLGAAIISLPVALGVLRPGTVMTRHVIAIAQMLDGALLIHLSGGRIETHFHVFGSLAFLACYRDWRVLVTSTVVVATDHIVRGFLAPISVYGTAAGSQWRWVEHAGWVVFIDAFLIYTIRESVKESRTLADRQAELEGTAELLREQAAELEVTRDKALAMTEVKSQFLANMSHEIRTPMNGIIGMSSLLAGTKMTDEQREFAFTIRNSADALLTVINDILDFSKMEAGKMAIERVPFSLRQVLEEVCDLLGARAREKDIEFLCSIPASFNSSVMGDPTRWRQVMTNLVANAVKFTKSGQIEIRTTVLQDGVESVSFRIDVIDTGIGIAEEMLPTVFESFSQADNSTSRRYGGTGLGLTICRQLTTLMGGEIGVESELGVGSTFWLRFELPKAPTNVSDSPISMREELDGKHILIVEDNACNRLILREQIQSWGCTVDQAVSGEEALKLLRTPHAQRQFDLIVSDMQMPGMTGLELAQAVADELPDAGLRTVILSSSAEAISDVEATRAGIVSHLFKPVRQSLLLNAVRNGLSASSGDKLHRQALPEDVDINMAFEVLLAEDNLVNQKVAVRALEKLGCDVTVAVNGRLAVDAVATRPYDLVFMDIQMPEMDGVEATQTIRALEVGTDRHQVIVAMTAHAMAGDRERLTDAGMDDYISKPFDLDTLRAMLRKWYGLRPSALREPPYPVAPEMPILDEDRLLESTGGDRDFELELCANFIDHGQVQLNRLREAIRDEDFAAIAEVSHSMKGASAAIGLSRMRVLSEAVESAARGADEECLHLAKRLHAEFDDARSFLVDRAARKVA